MRFLLVVFLIFFISCSGWLSASETALFSLSSVEVRLFRQKGNAREKRVARLLAEPRRLLVTILMLNVLMNLLVQNIVSALFGVSSSWWFSVGVPLTLTLVFGEVVPKSIAYQKNGWIARKVAPFIGMTERVLRPLRDAITRVTSAISALLFSRFREGERISTEELKHALRSEGSTDILKEETQLICGYLNLREDHVKALMCPRREILFFDIHTPLSQLIHLFVDMRCTRIPVCSYTLDHLLGIMTSEVFFLHRDRILVSQDLIPFLRKPRFVPESILGAQLLERFYDFEETLVMVVDEYGSISGLITLEDLFEVVAGKIASHHHAKPNYARASKDILIADGTLELVAFERIFDVHLESPNGMATIGGWLTERMGDIPKSGARYRAAGFFFHILTANAHRVLRVYIRRLKPIRKEGQ